MRRKDKEIADRAQIDAVIRRARICRLGMAWDNQPYIVPLCFGYDGSALYFHSAREGRKIDILRKNGAVCFEIDIEARVRSADEACKWGMHYRSVMGTGRATLIDDHAAKREALDLIMAQYGSEAPVYAEAALARMLIIRVAIEAISGKTSGP